MFRRGNRSKLWLGPQHCQIIVFIMFLVLVLTAVVFRSSNSSENLHSAVEFPKQKWNTYDSLVHFNPEREIRNGTDLIWQIPNSPKAVLFLAHGCNGRAVNFWDRSPNCPQCIGLPEERLLVLHALARNFAVITISSAGRCWTIEEERLIVKDIIRWWVKRHKLEMLPLVALGASSGGYFVSALAGDVRFSSITLMIAEGLFHQMDISDNYPPTLFVHMPKDTYMQQRISEFIEVFKNKGIDVAEIECIEVPLSPTFLADRIPGIDQTVSAKLFDLFREKGFIDDNSYMRRDGRATKWKEAVKDTKTVPLEKNLVHHVQEELNLAFAYHEMTSLQSEQIFKWFESHMT